MAEQNMRCAVTARSVGKLNGLAQSSQLIDAFPCDVTDAEGLAETVDQIEASLGAVDIAVLSAGIWHEMGALDYNAAACEKVMRVNYLGVVYAIDALLPLMIEQGRGHLVIVASVAGYCGLPRMVSYGPSKVALINYAEALMMALDGTGVRVSIVRPGYVDTSMTENNEFSMPYLVPAEEAASKIAAGIASGRFETAFPWQVVLMLKAARRAAYPLFFWIMRNFVKD